jgi:hypothetical protein
MKGFDLSKFKEFLWLRFDATLKTEKYEEQLYFYYAIKECQFDDILGEFKEPVLNSKNQILISYFLIDGIIEKDDYSHFISDAKESEWLQNYHYLLVYDKNNIDILLPSKATKDKQKKSYHDFYKLNIDSNIPLLNPITKVTEDIKKFIKERINSYFKHYKSKPSLSS